MPLISLREFARRNGVSPEAISKAVKTGRLPHVGGKIDPARAQPVWNRIKGTRRASQSIQECQPGPEVDTQVDSKVDTRGQVDTQVDTKVDTRGQVETRQAEVDTQVATPSRQVDTRPGAKLVAITIQLNGAEYLDLLKQAEDVNVSLPAFVLVRCGIQTWRLEAARGRPAAYPRGRPVRLALERRSVTIRVTEPEHEQLAGEASKAGMLLTQYIRKGCGLQVRTTSLPGTDERENEADDAWERLKRLGLKPEDYFED